MVMGRPNKGIEHLGNYDVSEQSQLRGRVVLQTLTGELSVAEACEQLGIDRSRFWRLRNQETWRLHPNICGFTSQLFYEGRLESHDGCEKQELLGSPFAGSGLFYVPVQHSGNQNLSPEEVEAVASTMATLVEAGVRWIDAKGNEHELTLDDVLVVALQRPGRRHRGPRCGLSRWNRRQVPGAASASGHPLGDELLRGGCPARNELSLRPTPAERRDESRSVHLHSRRHRASVRAGVSHTRVDAVGERLLSVPRDGETCSS